MTGTLCTMAKRTADDAGLDAPKEEEEASLPDEVEDDNGNDENEGSDASSEASSDASSASTEEPGLHMIALSWLEDKRNEGLPPQTILASLGIKLELENVPIEDQWDLLGRIVTSEGVAKAIFRSLFCAHRAKLPDINTLEDAVELIRKCSNIVILTGAGVSVSCGIPDFRSPGGLYSIIEEKYNLPEPQCLFDIHYLRDDPRPFFEFAKEIYPGKHKPSPTHYFIKELAERGKLLRNYTQNIDTLEMVAGIDASKVVNCHGSFATASCMMCKQRVHSDEIRTNIMNSVIPLCEVCNDDNAFMKPDIVFFGESLPERFDECLKEDTERIDLLLVVGSSLKVKPVAYVPEVIKPEVPQILVNRELVAQPHEFDYAYLGDCDAFVIEVCKRLGWTLDGKSPDSYIVAKPIVPTPTPIHPPASLTLTSFTQTVTNSASTDSTSFSTTNTITNITTTISTNTVSATLDVPLSPTLTSFPGLTTSFSPLPTPTLPPLPPFSTPLPEISTPGL